MRILLLSAALAGATCFGCTSSVTIVDERPEPAARPGAGPAPAGAPAPGAEACAPGPAGTACAAGACSGAPLWSRGSTIAGDHTALGVAAGPHGAVLATGHVHGAFDLGAGPRTTGERTAYVARWSPEGALEWLLLAEGASSGRAVAVDDDDHAVVAGTFEDGLALGDASASGGGAFVARIDRVGRVAWLATAPGELWVDAVGVDCAGEIVVAGGHSGTGAVGDLAIHTQQMLGAFVAKLTPDGTFAWARSYELAELTYVGGLAVQRSGRVALALSPHDPVHTGPGTTTLGNAWCEVVALERTGDERWRAEHGSPGRCFAKGVGIDPAGRVALTGIAMGETSALPAGDDSLFVSWWNEDGDAAQALRTGASDFVYPNALAVDGAGNVVVHGTYGLEGAPALVGAALPVGADGGKEDLFVLKLTPEGALAWAKALGSPSRERSWAVATDGAGGVLLAGDFVGHAQLDLGVGVPVEAAASGDWNLFVARLAP
jgi:hypothetical protein